MGLKSRRRGPAGPGDQRTGPEPV